MDELTKMLKFAADDLELTARDVDEALGVVRALADESVVPLAPRGNQRPTKSSRHRLRPSGRRSAALAGAAAALVVILLLAQSLLPSQHGGPAPVLAAGISPDGRSAFVVREGAAPAFTPLPEDAQHASISPDGSQIVFDAPSPGTGADRDVYLLNAGATVPVPVVAGPDFDSAPSLSPDGSLVAFLRMSGASTDSDGNLLCQACTTALFVTSAAGSVPRAITGADLHVGSQPAAWASSSDQLAYSTYPPIRPSIRLSDLTTGETALQDCQGLCAAPTWSPDGRSVVYVEGEISSDAPGRPVMLYSPTTGSQRRITSRTSFFTALAWSPSGPLIAGIGRDAEGRTAVFSIDSRTGETLKIADTATNDWGVQWTNDRRIAFQDIDEVGNPAIFTVRPDGTSRERLV